MIFDKYNKHFSLNELYLWKPFVFHFRGWHTSKGRWRHAYQPFIRWGRLAGIDTENDVYRIKWYPVIQGGLYSYTTHDYENLIFQAPLYYGYTLGQKVVRITDGKIHTIKEIHWSVNDLHVKTNEDGDAQLSYNLFIPIDDPAEIGRYANRIFEEDLFKL